MKNVALSNSLTLLSKAERDHDNQGESIKPYSIEQKPKTDTHPLLVLE